jgi:hypothetical protein
MERSGTVDDEDEIRDGKDDDDDEIRDGKVDDEIRDGIYVKTMDAEERKKLIHDTTDSILNMISEAFQTPVDTLDPNIRRYTIEKVRHICDLSYATGYESFWIPIERSWRSDKSCMAS